MKLSEALILRADCQKRLNQIKERIVNNVKVQEGDTPAESVSALLAQAEEVASTYQTLIRQINKTNLHTEFAAGMTLTDALAERDVLALRRNLYQELVNAANVRQERFTRSEVKFTITVNISVMQKQVDELAKAYRELDMKIQEANWRTELME